MLHYFSSGLVPTNQNYAQRLPTYWLIKVLFSPLSEKRKNTHNYKERKVNKVYPPKKFAQDGIRTKWKQGSLSWDEKIKTFKRIFCLISSRILYQSIGTVRNMLMVIMERTKKSGHEYQNTRELPGVALVNSTISRIFTII